MFPSRGTLRLFPAGGSLGPTDFSSIYLIVQITS
uniref:Uncharacterized protein n=1 Tax=Arundo donax TaxID=35708 RepID=A0A0A8XSD6_ARUDO